MNEKTSRGPYTGEWYDERNKRRMARYHSDPEYRAKANISAREGYRMSAGNKTPFDPRTNLHLLAAVPAGVGNMRVVAAGTRPLLTFTKIELAQVFNRPGKQVQQWAGDGRLPSAIFRGRKDDETCPMIDVYLLLEAKAIITSLGPYLSDLFYFRSDNKDAINACRAAVAEARIKLGVA